jgi:hypothetical protein
LLSFCKLLLSADAKNSLNSISSTPTNSPTYFINCCNVTSFAIVIPYLAKIKDYIIINNRRGKNAQMRGKKKKKRKRIF